METEVKNFEIQSANILVERQKRFEKDHNLVLTKVGKNLWVLLPKERTTPEELRKLRERRTGDIGAKEKKERNVDMIENVLNAVLQYYDLPQLDFLSREPIVLEARRMFMDLCCERGYDRDVVARLSGYCKNSFSIFRRTLNRIPNIYLKKEAIISFL